MSTNKLFWSVLKVVFITIDANLTYPNSLQKSNLISWLLSFWFFLRFSISALYHFIFIKAKFFHLNLCFQKEKTLKKCVFTTTAIHIYFTSLFSPYMQIPLHAVYFAGDKNVAFDFSDACLFGQRVYNYFDYQYFLSFASDFHFNL